eukprot:TRINITY_DN6056_c0_g1_i4.p1 TRINITY_DN6056_c0_g1~~TRINITY_DN6056_c0_g1_i4.p1  ORF type:complete len:164 (-),score=22.59 TRINITY_DN6056_c0_g1_i4:237-728(-)
MDSGRLTHINLLPLIALRPGMKGFTCEAIVLEIGQEIEVKQGQFVRDIFIADETASINASVWGEVRTQLHPADIVRISGSVARIHKEALTLSVTEEAAVTHLGEFTKVAAEVPNMSFLQWAVDPKSDGPSKRWMVRQPKPTMVQQLHPSEREVYLKAFPEGCS